MGDKKNIKDQPILHLNLKRKWFDMILSGVKTEEYREIKKSWNRVFTDSGIKIKGKSYHPNDVIICFSNGYSKSRDQFFIECKNFRVTSGKEEWGAEPGKLCYTIFLGKIIEDNG